jgi:hypothetical protein
MFYNSNVNDRSYKAEYLPYSDDIKYYIKNFITPTFLVKGDNYIEEVNLYDGTTISTIVHPVDIKDVMYSYDYTKIISSGENSIYIWDADKHTHLLTINNISKFIDDNIVISIVDISSDSIKILCIDLYNSFGYIFDINTGEELYEINFNTENYTTESNITELCFLNNTNIIFIQENKLNIINIESGEQIYVNFIRTFGIFKTKEYIACMSNENNIIYIMDYQFNIINQINYPDNLINNIRRIEISYDDKYMLLNSTHDIVLCDLENNTLKNIIITNNDISNDLNNNIFNVLFSPNGQWLICQTMSRHIIYSISTDKIIYNYEYIINNNDEEEEEEEEEEEDL